MRASSQHLGNLAHELSREPALNAAAERTTRYIYSDIGHQKDWQCWMPFPEFFTVCSSFVEFAPVKCNNDQIECWFVVEIFSFYMVFPNVTSYPFA